MLIEQAVYELLSNDGGIAAIASGRIFGGVLPQELKTYPAIAYRPPATGNRRVIRVMEGGCSLVAQRVHVFSAARRFSEASELDAAVFMALDEFFGTVDLPASSPMESIDIQAIFATNVAHAHQYDDRLQLHNYVTEFEIHYTDPNRL